MRTPARGHVGADLDGAGRRPDGRQTRPRSACRRAAGSRACPPRPGRGRIRLRADAGYFAGELAGAALLAGVEFTIGARRIAPLWRILDDVAEIAWTDAIDMTGAQVAVTGYCPAWWPGAMRLLIRRVALDVTMGQISGRPAGAAAPHPAPRLARLPLAELAAADAVYAYSFIVTNLDVSTPAQAAGAEHWYRHWTSIEHIFRDAKLGAALPHLPSGWPEVNTAWMSSPASASCPPRPDQARRLQTSGTRPPEATFGSASCPRTDSNPGRSTQAEERSTSRYWRNWVCSVKNFSAGQPNMRWCGDVSYLRTVEGGRPWS